MRAVQGRQLIEEGVITNETCDWDEIDYLDETEELNDADKKTVISENDLSSVLEKINPPSKIGDDVPKFNGLFDSSCAIPITKDGGIMKIVLKTGTGPFISEKDSVSYHYVGYTEDRKEPFTTSKFNRFPVRYRMGSGVSLPCYAIELSLMSMKKNEEALFLVSPEYGYGRLGSNDGCIVSKNSFLLWKIEVFDVNVASLCDDLLMKASFKERHDVCFDDIIEAANQEKDRGKLLYHSEDYKAALRPYRRALRLAETAIPRNSTDENVLTSLTLKILQHLAQVYLSLKRNIECCRYADEALELRRDDFTALRLKLAAQIRLGEYKSAHDCLKRCQVLCKPDYAERLADLRNQLLDEERRSKNDTKMLEKAMSKALFSSSVPNQSKPEVSAELESLVLEELDNLSKSDSSNPQQLPYDIKNFNSEEVEFIKREAKSRNLKAFEIEAEPGRNTLIVEK